MTVQLKTLIPEVRTHLDGAPIPTCEIYLRRAAKQFCQDSRVWDILLGSADISPPTENTRIEIEIPSTGSDPDFAVPEHGVINRLSLVALDDEEDGSLDPNQYEYDLETKKLIIAKNVVLQDAELFVHAILEPTDDAKIIADIVNRNRMPIIDLCDS